MVGNLPPVEDPYMDLTGCGSVYHLDLTEAQ